MLKLDFWFIIVVVIGLLAMVDQIRREDAAIPWVAFLALLMVMAGTAGLLGVNAMCMLKRFVIKEKPHMIIVDASQVRGVRKIQDAYRAGRLYERLIRVVFPWPNRRIVLSSLNDEAVCIQVEVAGDVWKLQYWFEGVLEPMLKRVEVWAGDARIAVYIVDQGGRVVKYQGDDRWPDSFADGDEFNEFLERALFEI